MKGRDPRLVYGGLVVFSGFLILAFLYGTLYSFGVFLKPLLDERGDALLSGRTDASS